MPKTRAPYPAEFRAEMVRLVRAGRTPGELSREFEPSDPNLAGVLRVAWSGGVGGGVFPLHGRCGGLVVGLGDGGFVPGVGVCSDGGEGSGL